MNEQIPIQIIFIVTDGQANSLVFALLGGNPLTTNLKNKTVPAGNCKKEDNVKYFTS